LFWVRLPFHTGFRFPIVSAHDVPPGTIAPVIIALCFRSFGSSARLLPIHVEEGHYPPNSTTCTLLNSAISSLSDWTRNRRAGCGFHVAADPSVIDDAISALAKRRQCSDQSVTMNSHSAHLLTALVDPSTNKDHACEFCRFAYTANISLN
jgi:hypothetical protein